MSSLLQELSRWRMDFFYRTFETAQDHARQAAAVAASSAQGLAQQVSSHTATLASQAGSLSDQAAERLKGLQLNDALQKQVNALQQRSRGAEDSLPSQGQLQAYGITSDFQGFVRSLTYSTFRDFPQTAWQEGSVGSTGNGDPDGRYLTPWQEQHALLVVQAVREINELRFVLCPKRMTDKQFWHTYFQLARKHLPPGAFETAAEAQQPDEHLGQHQLDLQARLQQLSASAQLWGANTAATVAALARPSSSRAEPGSCSAPALGRKSKDLTVGATHPGELDADPDLEAYLQVRSNSNARFLVLRCNSHCLVAIAGLDCFACVS